MDDFVVVCGACQTEPEFVTDDDGDAEACCPSCGQRDKVADASRIASEHVAHEKSLALQRTIQQALKGNKFVRYEGGRTSKRAFRWHGKKANN